MSSTPVRNRLLERLPTKASRRLLTACELVELTSGDILSEPSERIGAVYFQRTSVTVTAISIQRRNIIEYHRGILTVLDRKALEKISCECYRALPVHSSANAVSKSSPLCEKW
jgi:hypothetical protein